jgi:meso-butanediol dehydrogenase / (S,S)-butanediol dehydrogenase / diacetyl reductase
VSASDRAGGLAGRAHVAREAQVRALVERTLERFGRLDVLVNNAGIMTRGAFADAPVTDYEQMWATNVAGTFLCTQYALPPRITGRAVMTPAYRWVMP